MSSDRPAAAGPLASRPRLLAAALLPAAIVLAGCGRGDRPAVHPVAGTVTYRGAPLAGARVVFMSEAAPRAASATTDTAGRYALSTFEPGDGAIAGDHVVTLATAPAASSLPRLDDPRGEAEVHRQIAEARAALPVRINRRYADAATSGIRKTVVPGRNSIDIAIQD